MTGPSPETLHPMDGFPRVVFLRPLAAGRAERGVRIPSEEVARELAAMLGGSSAE